MIEAALPFLLDNPPLSNPANAKPLVSPPRSAIARCVLWMSGALFSFTAMAVAARELSHDMGTFQMLVVRSGFGVVLVTLLLAKSGFAQLRFTHFRLHITRNLIHFCGQLGWFYAISLIPLATVFAIEFTTPLWTAVFAAIFLREKLTAARVTAVVLGITGILVILRPGVATVEPAALAMMSRVHSYPIDDGQRWSSTVGYNEIAIETPRGCFTTKVDETPGSPLTPMPDEQLDAKFLDCASASLEKARARQALGMLRRLGDLPDIRALSDCLRNDAAACP